MAQNLNFFRRQMALYKGELLPKWAIILNFMMYIPYSKSLERAWSRGIVDRTKEYSFVLSTMPRLHARSRLLE